MAPSKPGRRFWISIRVANFFAPGTGSRRIDAKLRELYTYGQDADARTAVLELENRVLRQDLFRVTGEHNGCLVQDDFNYAGGLSPEFVNQKLLTGSTQEYAPGRTTIP